MRLADRFNATVDMPVAFFVLDVLEDWSVHGALAFDPVWTMVAASGVLFLAVMWLRKKRRRPVTRA